MDGLTSARACGCRGAKMFRRRWCPWLFEGPSMCAVVRFGPRTSALTLLIAKTILALVEFLCEQENP